MGATSGLGACQGPHTSPAAGLLDGSLSALLSNGHCRTSLPWMIWRRQRIESSSCSSSSPGRDLAICSMACSDLGP